jgi:hypothetical protein
VEIALDIDQPAPVWDGPPARRPGRGGLAFVALAAGLLGLGVLHFRQPAAEVPPSPAGSRPPPTVATALAGGNSFSTVDADAHEFIFSFALTTTSAWPVTMTGIRLTLPSGLSQVTTPSVVATPNLGRTPTLDVLPLRVTASWPVRIVLRLAVACDRFDTVPAAAARVVVRAIVAGRPGEADVASGYVMFGWPWSSSLSASACDRAVPPPLSRNNGVIRVGGHRR